MKYNDKLPCTFVICMCCQKLVLPWARTSYTTAITVPLQAAICSWFALCDRNLSNFLLKLVMFHLVTGNFTCLKLTPVVDFANSTSCTSTNLVTFLTPHHSAMWAVLFLHKNVQIPCKSSYLKITPFHNFQLLFDASFEIRRSLTSWGTGRSFEHPTIIYDTSGFYIALSQNGGWSFPGAKKSWSLNRLVRWFQQSLPRENSCTSATHVL